MESRFAFRAPATGVVALGLAVLPFAPLVPATVSAASPEAALTLTLRAGGWKRHDTVTQFELAPGAARALRGKDERGAEYVIQIETNGLATLHIPDLDRGESRTLHFTSKPIRGAKASTMEAKRSGSKIRIAQDGKSVLEYQAEPGPLPRDTISEKYIRGGYLHPIFTPSGRIVTDDFPANHVHHHGVWAPWTHTEFEGRHPDFWNMGEGKGRVEFVGVEAIWNGPVHGGFRARQKFVDLTSGNPWKALDETWDVRAYAVGAAAAQPYRMWDWTSTQTAAENRPLILLQHLYGGLGFRGNGAWDGAGNESFLTSEGETDRVKANMTRARWIHLSGLVDNRMAGVAILCHPDNFRFPQPMRVHPTEPFFCFAPSQMGDFRIEPGHPYVARYRFVVADGPPDRVELERLWNDFAHPAEVVIGGR